MFGKRQTIYTATTSGTIEEMALCILQQIEISCKPLKITFFYLPDDTAEYLSTYNTLHATVKSHFGNEAPLVSYVAQKPQGNILTAEVTCLTDSATTIEHRNRYKVLRNGNAHELVTEGIIPGDISQSTFKQAEDIFATISHILDEAGFAINDIYRQWNYIEGITVIKGGNQNYQEFNDARSRFYSQATWQGGYPSATGIGVGCGGVMIELYAHKGEAGSLPLDNPMQVSAHKYSQNVLTGNVTVNFDHRTTPKFERARIMGDTIYISGTAAIKGEDSLTTADIITQTEATMSIMNNLVAKENIPLQCNGSCYDHLRIYVKQEGDIPAVVDFMEEHYPTPQKHYLVSDICRPELLIEIEGTAHVVS